MAHGAVKHDYHILNPSPWPLVGSIGATVMAIGIVIWRKGLFGLDAGTWWPFALGAAIVAYCMFGWWMDVIKESRRGEHTPVVQLHLRYGMIKPRVPTSRNRAVPMPYCSGSGVGKLSSREPIA